MASVCDKMDIKDYQCGICQELLFEPTTVASCQHTFCMACIKSVRRPYCPVCRRSYVPRSIQSVNMLIKNTIVKAFEEEYKIRAMEQHQTAQDTVIDIPDMDEEDNYVHEALTPPPAYGLEIIYSIVSRSKRLAPLYWTFHFLQVFVDIAILVLIIVESFLPINMLEHKRDLALLICLRLFLVISKNMFYMPHVVRAPVFNRGFSRE